MGDSATEMRPGQTVARLVRWRRAVGLATGLLLLLYGWLVVGAPIDRVQGVIQKIL